MSGMHPRTTLPNSLHSQPPHQATNKLPRQAGIKLVGSTPGCCRCRRRCTAAPAVGASTAVAAASAARVAVAAVAATSASATFAVTAVASQAAAALGCCLLLRGVGSSAVRAALPELLLRALLLRLSPAASCASTALHHLQRGPACHAGSNLFIGPAAS